MNREDRPYFASHNDDSYTRRIAVKLGFISEDFDDYYALEKNDELGVFKSDDEAIAFAVAQAALGDRYAKQELKRAQYDPFVRLALGEVFEIPEGLK